MSSSETTSERTPIRQVVAASFIGTTIEWYDFFLYGTAAALVFNKLFFPKADPSSGTLLALATYAGQLRSSCLRTLPRALRGRAST